MELQLRNQFLLDNVSSPRQVIEFLEKVSKKRIFLIIDLNVKNNFLNELVSELEIKGLVSGAYRHDGREPSTDTVDVVKKIVATLQPDSIMAVGGGSTLDLMKAISVLHYLDISAANAQGANLEIEQKLFSFAVPTTAGSGSEATKSAVLTNPNVKLKRGINHFRVIPDVAILAPSVLEGIPDKVFVASVFDGLTHALESLLGQSGTEDIKKTAQHALSIFVRQITQLSYGGSVNIDGQILKASYLAGVSICNSETGPTHAISYPLSEYCNYGHGEAIGLLLPKVLRVFLEKDKGFHERLESHTGLLADEFISKLENVYSKYVMSQGTLKPISDINTLAARSLQLQGAINNSPLIWDESLSRQVLRACNESN